MIWLTFYGKTMEISQLSHQHLSNILWYYELVLEVKPGTEMKFGLPEIRKKLFLKYGDIKLPYRPNVAFVDEIRTLEKKGYLIEKKGSPNKNIIVGVATGARWVGEVIY